MIITGDFGNSYTTLSELDSYFSGDYQVFSRWDELTISEREQVSIQATYEIDNSFDFIGEKTTSTQNLEFPRNFDDYHVYYNSYFYNNNNIVPTEVKRAEFEQIKYIIYKKKYQDNLFLRDQGLKRNKVDVLEKEWFQNEERTRLSEESYNLLSKFFSVNSSFRIR